MSKLLLVQAIFWSVTIGGALALTMGAPYDLVMVIVIVIGLVSPSIGLHWLARASIQ